jgi:hemolysin activation/secretion protein
MKTNPMKPHRTLLALAAVASLAHAQVAPDAGRTLQQQQQQPVEAPKPAPTIVIPATPTTAPAPGGATVPLKAVLFHGQTKFTDAALQALVRDTLGKPLDMAGLWGVAQRVSDAYHAAGYPFARAFLPPQELQGGTLRIEIVEGRYGQVRAQGDAPLAAQAQSWLKHLVPGDVVESAPLERAALLLNDLPGLVVTPVMRPGAQPGTGDLDVDIRRAGSRVRGSVGVDNQGNRFTGPYRAQVDARTGSALAFGDQVSVHAMHTDSKLWFGSLGYSLPLGAQGLRAHAEFAHTYYQLGQDFAALDATGTANVASTGLAWPLLRSQRANLTVDATFTHKAMRDVQGAAGTSSAKSSNALPLALNFDQRDEWGGGGLTYGAVTLTAGRLDLGATLAVSDRTTARTAGAYARLNLDVARSQSMGGEFSLFGRLAAQWANKNLDSSEGFGPGGVTGVRAFPGGEAYGDAGWVMQFEARKSGEGLQPYGFYDMGGSRTNIHAWTPGNDHRFISGVGLGVRGQFDRWTMDASGALAVRGGPATSEKSASGTQFWVTASMAF